MSASSAWTVTHHREPRRSYGCVQLLFVRDGSLILDAGRATPKFARTGDVVLIAAGTLLGYQSEGPCSVTVLLVDTGYLVDQAFWQYLDLIPDRLAAHDFATELYPEPIQLLHLCPQEIEQLIPVLDELVTRSEKRQCTAGFFRKLALLCTVLGIVAPHAQRKPNNGCTE